MGRANGTLIERRKKKGKSEIIIENEYGMTFEKLSHHLIVLDVERPRGVSVDPIGGKRDGRAILSDPLASYLCSSIHML